jgi:hypothetical protein
MTEFFAPQVIEGAFYVGPTMARVEWIDSGHSRSNGWEPAEAFIEAAEEPDYMVAVSVGFLLHQDDQHVILTQTFDVHNKVHMNGMTIARASIVKLEPLMSISIPEPRDDE